MAVSLWERKNVALDPLRPLHLPSTTLAQPPIIPNQHLGYLPHFSSPCYHIYHHPSYHYHPFHYPSYHHHPYHHLNSLAPSRNQALNDRFGSLPTTHPPSRNGASKFLGRVRRGVMGYDVEPTLVLFLSKPRCIPRLYFPNNITIIEGEAGKHTHTHTEKTGR